ncbi:ComF family protein [Eubacterium ruminantium]|uniref:ComF family protein n=1 Tax=Eubacterium ruminantium TaxID=42322 RepID=UPI0015680D9D|nr:ComF family protein [Eubacterium ruminantium]
MFDNLIDAIFPPRCAVCDEVLPVGRKGICDFCRGRLSYITEPRCLKCGKEIDSENDEYCFDCSQNIRSYDLGFPVFNYIPPISDALVRFKYHGREEYASFYGREIAGRFKDEFRNLCIEAIVPVPLSKERYRNRGYNQAELLADVISEQTGIVKLNLLARVKNTAPQKELDDVQREKNLLQAFAIDKAYSGGIPKSILLVDDIYTTGATIEGCTKILKNAGVQRVYYTSVAIGKV